MEHKEINLDKSKMFDHSQTKACPQRGFYIRILIPVMGRTNTAEQTCTRESMKHKNIDYLPTFIGQLQDYCNKRKLSPQIYLMGGKTNA